MADFINTIDALGDDAVIDSIINRTITEFKDDRITKVGQSAFQKCTSLKTLDIPSVLTINYGAFYGCTALSSINIPAVTSINAYNAFSNCKALTKVVLPVCTNIGNGAFSYCTALKTVDCKASGIISFGNTAFGSAPVKALVIRSNSVATMANTNALLGTDIYYSKGYIYVPTALVDSYKAAANWSTYADQFRNLEEWTVDGTVTGELDMNRHMVRFFNSDGTLLGYQIVATGATATYSGTPVYPDDPTWKFNGFVPNPTNVTEDMDCYAQYQEPFSLETASWARISEISNEGTAANYMSVGDMKSVYLNGTMGTLALDTTLYVYVLGINHNSEVEGSGVHFGTFKDASGKDIGLDCGSSGQISDGSKVFNMVHWGNSTSGGWKRCDMRYDILGSTDVAPDNYGSEASKGDVGYDATATCATNPVPGTLMSCLPSNLRSVLKPITKYSADSGYSTSAAADKTTIIPSLDYLPLLAEFEVLGERRYGANGEQNFQRQYDYFAEGSRTSKYAHSGGSTTKQWWTRSATYADYNSRYVVIGPSHTYAAASAPLVVPIFMV